MWRFGTKAGDPEAMYQSPLFKAHAEGLFNTIDVAIGLAEHGELMSLSETLVDLGRKHVKYGVLSDHYTIVGQALMHTLKAALGDAFTGEVEYGWAQVYAIVSSGMEEGAFYQQIEFGDAEETPSTAASKVSNPGAPLA